MDLYLVAVILNPTKKQRDDDGAVPTVIVQPQAVIAKDREQARGDVVPGEPELERLQHLAVMLGGLPIDHARNQDVPALT